MASYPPNTRDYCWVDGKRRQNGTVWHIGWPIGTLFEADSGLFYKFGAHDLTYVWDGEEWVRSCMTLTCRGGHFRLKKKVDTVVS